MRGISSWIQRGRVFIKLWHITLVAYISSSKPTVGPDFAASAVQITNPIVGIPKVFIVVKLDPIRGWYVWGAAMIKEMTCNFQNAGIAIIFHMKYQ